MRFVEFVGFMVALIGLFAWLLGRPHTLESIERDRMAGDTPRAYDAARDPDLHGSTAGDARVDD